MKTDDLIAAISADAGSARPPIASVLWLATVTAVIVAVVLFFSMLPLRPDFAYAISDPHFLFKWVLTLSLLASAMVLVMQLAKPQPISKGRLLVLLAPLAVLGLGVVYELIRLPSSEWMPTMIGHNAAACLVLIPTLSLLPLGVLLFALRQGAPSRPTLAGAAAGLAASGIGTTLYAAHCMDDSPLFIGAWYVLGTAFVTMVGAYFGSRLLRW